MQLSPIIYYRAEINVESPFILSLLSIAGRGDEVMVPGSSKPCNCKSNQESSFIIALIPDPAKILCYTGWRAPKMVSKV